MYNFNRKKVSGKPNYQVEASTYKKSYLALSKYWEESSRAGVNETYDVLTNNYLFAPREVVLSSPFDYGNGYLSLTNGVSLF